MGLKFLEIRVPRYKDAVRWTVLDILSLRRSTLPSFPGNTILFWVECSFIMNLTSILQFVLFFWSERFLRNMIFIWENLSANYIVLFQTPVSIGKPSPSMLSALRWNNFQNFLPQPSDTSARALVCNLS